MTGVNQTAHGKSGVTPLAAGERPQGSVRGQAGYGAGEVIEAGRRFFSQASIQGQRRTVAAVIPPPAPVGRYGLAVNQGDIEDGAPLSAVAAIVLSEACTPLVADESWPKATGRNL